MVTVRDVLDAPFVVRSETVPASNGSWIRVVSYPELGCRVSGNDVLHANDELELERVRYLVRAIEAGTPVIPLRSPVPDSTVEDLLVRASLDSWIARLDEDVKW